MRRIWMCVVCLLLCLLMGCKDAQEDAFGTMGCPVSSDGTVIEVDNAKRQIIVEITKSRNFLQEGDCILTCYDSDGDFLNEAPKEGMYVSVSFWADGIEKKEDFEKKDGYIFIESDAVYKNISFVDGKWSEGTYD